MTLKDYLHSFNITLEAFSRDVDIPYTTLTKYVYGQRIPTLTYMNRINKHTKGAVSANDFYSTVSSEDWEWRITYERDFSQATDDAKKILGDMDIQEIQNTNGIDLNGINDNEPVQVNSKLPVAVVRTLNPANNQPVYKLIHYKSVQ